MNKAFIVVGCQNGDEAKGSTVDFLTRKHNSNLTVRFSGGSQCFHNVVDDRGNYHGFSQFGSGSLAGAKTLLGKNVLINPLNLIKEEEKLSKLINNPFEKLFIDGNAVIITPYHRAANKLLEIQRNKNKHGSCGQGIWETRSDSINNPGDCLKVKDFGLYDFETLIYKLNLCRERMLKKLSENDIIPNTTQNEAGAFFINPRDIGHQIRGVLDRANVVNFTQIKRLINSSINPVFEGNQGILLDEDQGFYPYTTGTNCTSKYALEMLKDCGWTGDKEVIGVTRTFATRHGAGPFPTEYVRLNDILFDKYNLTNPWQDNFRLGWLDINLLRYSLRVDGNIDSLSVSHIDELQKLDTWNICHYYEEDGKKWILEKLSNPTIEDMEKLTKKLLNSKPIYEEYDKDEVLDVISWELERKIKVKSFGPKCNEKELVF